MACKVCEKILKELTMAGFPRLPLHLSFFICFWPKFGNYSAAGASPRIFEGGTNRQQCGQPTLKIP